MILILLLKSYLNKTSRLMFNFNYKLSKKDVRSNHYYFQLDTWLKYSDIPEWQSVFDMLEKITELMKESY